MSAKPQVEPGSGRDMVGQNPTGRPTKSSAGKRRQEAKVKSGRGA